ncbi:TIM barrel protein [Fibrella sp. WM1]|uniref:TIM barrel protein n=1 Tax=Fibrella musci TaxID=3242485 RepID=UPI00352055F2
MTTRRVFLKSTGGLAALSSLGATQALADAPAPASDDQFKLGMAGYTFVHFKLDQALEMLRKVDVHYLCIKDFHLPLDSTPEQIAEFHAKLKESNVTGYAVGPIYMKTEAEVDRAFAYAKRVGVKLIVAVPNVELLPLVDKRVKEYDFRVAIHNHGPDIALYPNPASIYKEIKDLDPRIGFCFDMGHDKRFGEDPVADLQIYAKRIFDIHLKNVSAATKEGKTCELGRGVIDIPAFVQMLRKIGYSGSCSLEYEKDMKDPLAGIAESVGYFRGVCEATRSGKRRS